MRNELIYTWLIYSFKTSKYIDCDYGHNYKSNEFLNVYKNGHNYTFVWLLKKHVEWVYVYGYQWLLIYISRATWKAGPVYYYVEMCNG